MSSPSQSTRSSADLQREEENGQEGSDAEQIFEPQSPNFNPPESPSREENNE